LAPGFVAHFSILAAGLALLATLIWCWLIVTSPRSPMRGIMHWMAGLTLFWLLIATLWMPWIDYGKSYRQVAASLAKALPGERHCIINVNTANSILAALDYFEDIRTVTARSPGAKNCDLLLMQGSARDGGVDDGCRLGEDLGGRSPGRPPCQRKATPLPAPSSNLVRQVRQAAAPNKLRRQSLMKCSR
jgi:4-amino-4-deoxy-L-arabinose transferase-like glycosyltransferase